MDEVGFSFLSKTVTTWAPKGQTPVLRRVSQRRALSTVVALTTNGRLLKRHFEHAVRGPDVIVALRHFQRHLPGPLIIIWDRLSAHRDKRVQQWVSEQTTISLEWLPPYAPVLNPEEACHGNVKRHLQNATPINATPINATPINVAQLRQQVNAGFARLRRRPDLLQSFFHHAGMQAGRQACRQAGRHAGR